MKRSEAKRFASLGVFCFLCLPAFSLFLSPGPLRRVPRASCPCSSRPHWRSRQWHPRAPQHANRSREIKIWRHRSSGAEAVLDLHEHEANSEHAASAFDEAAAPGQHRYLPADAFSPKSDAPVSGALPRQAATLDVANDRHRPRAGFDRKPARGRPTERIGGAAGQTLGIARRQRTARVRRVNDPLGEPDSGPSTKGHYPKSSGSVSSGRFGEKL
jgi:hypothetical protein